MKAETGRGMYVKYRKEREIMAEIKYHSSAEVPTLQIAGDFTESDNEVFQTVTGNIPAEEKELYLDLTELNYIDSAGIGNLLRLKMNSHKTGRTMKMSEASSEVMRIFRVSGITRMFE